MRRYKDKYKKGRTKYVEYKKDSTKGRAILNPESYKGDCLVQAWVDSRKLAVLSVWLDNGGANTKFLSDVLKDTIDQVVGHLIESGEAEMIEFCGEARELLERKYKANLNPGGRGEKNRLSNLILDNRRKGLGENPYSMTKPTMSEEEAKAKFSHYEPPTPIKSELSKEAIKRVVDALSKKKVEPPSECKAGTGITTVNEDETKPSSKKESDVPRAMTKEELNDMAIAFEKKQREQLLELKNMPAASEIFKQNV